MPAPYGIHGDDWIFAIVDNRQHGLRWLPTGAEFANHLWQWWQQQFWLWAVITQADEPTATARFEALRDAFNLKVRGATTQAAIAAGTENFIEADLDPLVQDCWDSLAALNAGITEGQVRQWAREEDAALEARIVALEGRLAALEAKHQEDELRLTTELSGALSRLLALEEREPPEGLDPEEQAALTELVSQLGAGGSLAAWWLTELRGYRTAGDVTWLEKLDQELGDPAKPMAFRLSALSEAIAAAGFETAAEFVAAALVGVVVNEAFLDQFHQAMVTYVRQAYAWDITTRRHWIRQLNTVQDEFVQADYEPPDIPIDWRRANK